MSPSLQAIKVNLMSFFDHVLIDSLGSFIYQLHLIYSDLDANESVNAAEAGDKHDNSEAFEVIEEQPTSPTSDENKEKKEREEMVVTEGTAGVFYTMTPK